tara:strand:+ start:2582 stop:2698 length:117 start_codon:yes stop_codon:yes gene_type:complete
MDSGSDDPELLPFDFIAETGVAFVVVADLDADFILARP